MCYNTLTEACRAWVEGFNAIPQSALRKIVDHDDSIQEITPPAVGDRVYIFDDDEHSGEYGKITETKYDEEEDLYLIKLDNGGDAVLSKDCFEVEYENFWPIWGYLWSFGEQIDEDWVRGTYCESHLQEMANCGFRIYDSEDFGLIFGIDGAGYSFYDSHFVPLYKARGLQWHITDDTEKETA